MSQYGLGGSHVSLHMLMLAVAPIRESSSLQTNLEHIKQFDLTFLG